MATVASKSGLILLNAYNVASDLKSYSLEGVIDELDKTGYGVTWREFQHGLRSGAVGFDGLFNNAAGKSDPAIWSNLGTGDDLITVCPAGDTIGTVVYSSQHNQGEYNVNSDHEDLVRVSYGGNANVRGLERGVSMHDLSAETSTGNSTTVDNGASSAAGGSAFLHLTDGTGWGAVDITLRHSTDNFAADDTLLGTFTQATADSTAERITFTGTVKQYVRAVHTLTTVSSVTYMVTMNRH